jgi:tryptophan synthase beta chain
LRSTGHDFVPPGIHAGGLRYHGDSALVSQLYNEGLIEAVAVPQLATFEAGLAFARSEGIIPAPESNHAIRACIDEAMLCKESGEPKTLLFNLSGHGHFDMAAYDSYFRGELSDYAFPEEEINKALANLPKVAQG